MSKARQYTVADLATVSPVGRIVLFRQQILIDGYWAYQPDTDRDQAMAVIAWSLRVAGYATQLYHHHGAVVVDVLPIRDQYGRTVARVVAAPPHLRLEECPLYEAGGVILLAGTESRDSVPVLADEASVFVRRHRGDVYGRPYQPTVDDTTMGWGYSRCAPESDRARFSARREEER